jgi:hypothetical protein
MVESARRVDAVEAMASFLARASGALETPGQVNRYLTVANWLSEVSKGMGVLPAMSLDEAREMISSNEAIQRLATQAADAPWWQVVHSLGLAGKTLDGVAKGVYGAVLPSHPPPAREVLEEIVSEVRETLRPPPHEKTGPDPSEDFAHASSSTAATPSTVQPTPQLGAPSRESAGTAPNVGTEDVVETVLFRP